MSKGCNHEWNYFQRDVPIGIMEEKRIDLFVCGVCTVVMAQYILPVKPDGGKTRTLEVAPKPASWKPREKR